MSTIAQVATPIGTGGVSVIRISGEKSFEILKRIFLKKVPFEHGKLYHGEIIKDNDIIDDVMAVVFYSPKSFTGEEVCEIHCHGSIMGVSLILEYICEMGARPAEPGEFTKRAFLNGKIDLTQAEAISDFIFASSKQSAKAAAHQLRGKLKEKICGYQNVLTDVIAEAQAAIEYPEEDLEGEITLNVLDVLKDALKGITCLSKTFSSGQFIKNGINCVVVGKTNVGKSSLLNNLCGFERAIVSNISGTTRDTIEHSFDIKGVRVNLIDTAGIRQTNDDIELQGIIRSKDALLNADIVIFLADFSCGITQEDVDILNLIDSTNVIYVLNKCDTVLSYPSNMINEDEYLHVSAKTGKGIEELKEIIFNMLITDNLNNEVVITNLRHKELLLKSAKSLEEGILALEEGVDMDCVTIDLNSAWLFLGEITGNTISEEIIDRIFSRFCLGK